MRGNSRNHAASLACCLGCRQWCGQTHQGPGWHAPWFENCDILSGQQWADKVLQDE